MRRQKNYCLLLRWLNLLTYYFLMKTCHIISKITKHVIRCKRGFQILITFSREFIITSYYIQTWKRKTKGNFVTTLIFASYILEDFSPKNWKNLLPSSTRNRKAMLLAGRATPATPLIVPLKSNCNKFIKSRDNLINLWRYGRQLNGDFDNFVKRCRVVCGIISCGPFVRACVCSQFVWSIVLILFQLQSRFSVFTR